MEMQISLVIVSLSPKIIIRAAAKYGSLVKGGYFKYFKALYILAIGIVGMILLTWKVGMQMSVIKLFLRIFQVRMRLRICNQACSY